MADQQARLRRAQRLAEKLVRLEEARLFRLEEAVKAIRSSEARAVGVMGAGEIDPRLSELQLRGLAARKIDAISARDAQLAQVRTHRLQVKQIERLSDRLDTRQQRIERGRDRRRLASNSKVSLS